MKSLRPATRPDLWKRTVYLGLALVAGVPAANACGPLFPNRYLDAGSEQLLAAPEAWFADELMRLLPPGTPRVPEREYQNWTAEPGPTPAERTAQTDVSEVATALRTSGTDAVTAARLAETYGRARAQGEEAPDGTPAEFALYLRGAQAWKRGETAAARAAWRAVLALPESERCGRGVWAAYMLGRSHLVLPEDEREEAGAGFAKSSESEEALRWFAQAEALADGGASDSLGLAGEAKGWRARLLAARGDYPAAVGLYLERLKEGDDTALQSLRRVAREIVAGAYGESRAACVRDANTRGLVVAFLLSRADPILAWSDDSRWGEEARGWAIDIHEAGGREVHGADRLAWLAYEGGLFGLAADWLKLAPVASSEADWLRSKLALRSGDAAVGDRWLARALREDGLKGEQRRLAWAELARTRLALDQVPEALAAFLRGDHWEDAAFVAERILTVDELARVVDEAPVYVPASGPDPEREAVAEGWTSLRHLLARRLMRENQGRRSLAYMPDPLREAAAAYLTDLGVGFEAERPVGERAANLWRAARLLRERGLELVGTELEPDWAIWGGDFDVGSYARDRLRAPLLEGGVFAPTPDEQARIRQHAAPERRFHYRYQAADLAWWAASLMPDQNEETARVLWEAGGWLKARDPKAAEPFYRALVLRCGRTALGREAARLRWFPAGLAARETEAGAVRSAKM